MKRNHKPNYYEYLHSLSSEQVEALFYKAFAKHKDKQELYKAYEFMKQRHGQQMRKDEKSPYAIHLARIALAMRQIFHISRKKILIAGLFHDLLEDTPTTFAELELNWGAEVASLVQIMTNPKLSYKTEAIRFEVRQQKWEKMQKASRFARQLWFFDNYDNMADYAEVPKNSPNYIKIPRWMGQAEIFYLPNAKFLGPKYYNAIKQVYDKISSFGFKPQTKEFANSKV